MSDGKITKTGRITEITEPEDGEEYVLVSIEGEKYPQKVFTSNKQGKSLAQACFECAGTVVNYDLKANKKGDKTYWNLYYVEPADTESPSNDAKITEKSPVSDDRTHDIHKQVCLKAAVTLHSGLGIGAIDDVNKACQTFMRWLEPDNVEE